MVLSRRVTCTYCKFRMSYYVIGSVGHNDIYYLPIRTACIVLLDPLVIGCFYVFKLC